MAAKDGDLSVFLGVVAKVKDPDGTKEALDASEIESLADLLSIPQERIPAFLKECGLKPLTVERIASTLAGVRAGSISVRLRL